MASLPLSLNTQATARMLVVAFVVGGAVTTAALAALVETFVSPDVFPPAMGPTYVGVFAIAGSALAVAALLVVKLRQPRGARIEWSEESIVEWDGDGVRCAIPRSSVKMGTLVTTLKAKSLTDVVAGAALQRPQLRAEGGAAFAVGGALTIGDDEGRRIFAGEGTQLAWLNDRLSTVDTVRPLYDAFADAPAMPPELGRAAENRLVVLWLCAIVAYVTLVLASMAILAGDVRDVPWVLIALAAATLFGLLRALAPLVRAWRLGRAARRFTQRATLVGNEGRLLHVDVDGERVVLDPRPWKHADALLHERRGAVWLTRARDDLETEGVRAARRWRRRALQLEALGRALLPLAALALFASLFARFEQWRPIVRSTASVTPSFFDENESLVRVNGGVVEVVGEGRQKTLKLHGAPQVFARGPDDTVAFQSGGVLRFHYLTNDFAARPKSPLPAARLVASGETNRDYVSPALVITSAGKGELWSVRSIEVERIATLAPELGQATHAVFAPYSERVYVALASGAIEGFDLTGAHVLSLPPRGAVRAMAVGWGIAVADERGVRVFDGEGRQRASVDVRDVVALHYGAYPTWMHTEGSALLVMTGDGVLRALDGELREKRRFRLQLPRGERPAAIATNPREVLVSTDRGGVWQLWIH